MPLFSIEQRPSAPHLLRERRPIPLILDTQVDAFHKDSLHMSSGGRFNPTLAQHVLQQNEGKDVIGIDMGGGKATVIPFTVRKGILVPDESRQKTVLRKDNPAGYLSLLQEIGEEADEKGIPIGVSSAGVIKGTQLLETPNMPAFLKELQEKFGGDFKRLLPSVAAVRNDAVAAIIPAIMHALNEGLLPKGEGEIIGMEPGHVRLLLDHLQRPLQYAIPNKPCGMFGQEFVCVEQVVGGVAGIESLWEQTTGLPLDGEKISELYHEHGDRLATALYDTSATFLATAIKGMGKALGLSGKDAKSGLILPIIGGGFGGAGFVMDVPRSENSHDLNVTFHGSVNKVPDYMTRTELVLGQDGTPINPSFTGDFSLNSGAEGAALAALMALSSPN